MIERETRWDRMERDLREAGLTVKRDQFRGRDGVIVYHPDGIHLTIIHDNWWAKNANTWLGFQGWTENKKTGLVVGRDFRPAKDVAKKRVTFVNWAVAQVATTKEG